MANRPAPKRSSFGASHPIEHVEVAPVAEAVSVVSRPAPAVEPALAEVPQATAPATGSTGRRPGPTASGRVKKKAATFADGEIIERIRAAWFHTPTTSGERELSFSDFLLEAALARTAEREKKYNKGEAFPPVPAGQIGVGRKG